MESPRTGDETTGYYQNSLTPDIENTTQSHYQKLNVEVISVGDNQYDQLSPETVEDTKPYDGYLQLPEFNQKNIESNYDYLKLYGSVKTKQCPAIGSIELSDFSSGHNVDTENRPSDKRKQDIVALDSIHLNEDIYHEINDTARPNLNQARQGSKKHVNDSQTLHTNTDAASAERSKTSVSKRTYLTWRQKCMFSILGVGITIIIAVGTVIYFVVNKESEKETQNYVSCTDVLDARLYVGPKEMLCIIPKSEQFDYLGFYHGNGLNNSLYGIVLNKNGTIFQLHKPNTDIYVRLIKVTSQYMLIITFSNVSCAMDGIYRLALMRQVAGGPEEYKSTSGYLQVTSLSGKPTISLNADKVIDLGFPDGNYFRSAGTHICEGRIGQYHSYLEIDITYDNGKSFQHIPKESIDLSRQNTSDGCSTNQTVIFGLRFSSEMDGARLRCRVSDRIDDFTFSEEFSLITRNICNCGVSNSYRGHPNNCKVQVYCVEGDGIMYPRGIACIPNQCRNSITGVCSSDCSVTVCNEAVPPDFCTTPATPTTSESPPPSVPTVTVLSNYYQVKLGNTVTLVCQVVATPKHSVVQWTKVVSGQTRNINMGKENKKYSGSTVNVSSLTISAAANSDEGYYTCTATNVAGTGFSQQTYLDITGCSTEKPTITLNADQVIELIFPDGNYFRGSRTHKCEGRIGQPPSKLEIDITYDNGTSFQHISIGSIVFYRTNTSDGCSIKETVLFGIKFSSDMDGARLRCRVSDSNNDFTLSEELRLIPRNICNCGLSDSYRGHPSNCKVQVYCIEDAGIMYPTGIACPTNECRNSRTGSCTNDCSETVCNEAVPSDFCTTPAPLTTTLVSSTCKPNEDANLQLHPDQIAGLGSYRSWLLHTCEINVGYPPGEIRIEMLKPGDTEFSNLNVNFEAVTDTFGNTTCSVTRTVTFGITFTSEMDKATIRCGVKHELLPNDQLVYSNNETVSLIPFDFCQNYTEKTSYHPHPTNCHNFVQCQNGLPYAGICPANSCFGVAETNSCDHCYLVTCPTDITTTSRPETTVPVPSIDFPGKPVLKLSVDQVIDLGFYRDRNVHSCAGIIGNPMRELILEIVYVNTKEYKEIPGSILRDLHRNKSTTESQNYEKIQFALLFSSEMKDSKIRCRPSGNVNNETIAEESLTLIPRDICSCGDSGDYRGHPGRCDSYVLCLAADNIMYPYGRACPNGHCRNSLTGICSTDCSDAVCNEGVPADFCSTTTIPKTTPVLPKPSVAKPSKPSIDPQLHAINGKNVMHTCTGNVGNPPGVIEFLVRKNVEDNFTVSSSTVTWSEVTPNDNCNNEQSFYHQQVVTSEWNMTTIKCRIVNQRTITGDDDINSYISDETDIILIADDQCPAVGHVYNPHPRGCGYYVECYNSIAYGRQCAGSCFNFNATQPACIFCNNAPPPCNATVS